MSLFYIYSTYENIYYYLKSNDYLKTLIEKILKYKTRISKHSNKSQIYEIWKTLTGKYSRKLVNN